MPKKSLGKGIDALILSSGVNTPGVQKFDQQKVLDLDITMVKPNPEQPRKDFDEDSLEELAQSIREKGVIQPILVQEAGFGEYIVIAGERRYRASLKAGKSTIPAIIRKYDEEETLEIALIENLQRENLNPLEEALAFQKLMDHFELTQDEIATRLGKSRSAIANSLRLIRLPTIVQDHVRKNLLSAGHARAILSLSGGENVATYSAEKIIRHGLSVREAENMVKQVNSGIDIDSVIGNIEEARKANNIVPASDDGSNKEAKQNDLESVRTIARGATIKDGDESIVVQKNRPVEFWDMEEKLIELLGTKVNFKGDLSAGKIEIIYYSMDDLGRVYDLLTKDKR